jgi:hypothetical protein
MGSPLYIGNRLSALAATNKDTVITVTCGKTHPGKWVTYLILLEPTIKLIQQISQIRLRLLM